MYKIREKQKSDEKWIRENSVKTWGAEHIIYLKEKLYPEKLEGFIAEDENKKIVALLTYRFLNDYYQIITLSTEIKYEGIGTLLIEKLVELAKKKNVKKIIVWTTNDNTDALRFYQSRGFELSKLYPKAVVEDRKIKKEIPEFGNFNIPINDIIELEYFLGK